MKTRGSHLIAEEKKLEIKSWNKQQSSVINIRAYWAKAALWGFFILLRKGTEQKAFWCRARCGADPHGYSTTTVRGGRGEHGHRELRAVGTLHTAEINTMKAPESQWHQFKAET